ANYFTESSGNTQLLALQSHGRSTPCAHRPQFYKASDVGRLLTINRKNTNNAAHFILTCQAKIIALGFKIPRAKTACHRCYL
ncbi:MAG: hypothetical protein ACIRZ8_13330, partial [Lactiplantibacillus plantarum]